MHLIDHEVGFLGAAPIVGGTISLAVGAAMASAIRGDGAVTIAYFGDGATGEGVLYEALNMAAIYKLPIIFVCENNLYSTHMSILEIRSSKDISHVAQPFGVKSLDVDGNDVLKVYESAGEAVAWARAGKGPVFAEYKTYRLRGHVGPDDNVQGTRTDIRPEAELQEWKKRDPLLLLEQELIKVGVSDAEITSVRGRIEKKVAEAHNLAQKAERPAPSELRDYVFSN
jgi:pyruvate dehydrogenase E1 component alpha subunit